ncbi:MAG: methyltransferase family protein [Actinomycetota bacterium]
MRRTSASLGTIAFFLLAPGIVAGVIPWWLTGWHVGQDWPAPLRLVGLVLVAASVIVLAEAFVRFVREGRGTPAPIAPTERLVVGGFYRYVRNPMYVAVLATIVGEALALGSPVLLVYGLVVWVAFATFIRAYEEPHLAARFGEGYLAYRTAVPAWLPRLHPWRPPEDDAQGRSS